MKGSFKVEGLAEAERALLDLKADFDLTNTQVKNVITKALKEAGQPMADAETAFAPVLSGDLALSPKVSTKLSRRQRKLHKKESPIEVFVGPTPHAKAVQTEFGNAHQAAKPHLRPAFDATVHIVAEQFGKSLAVLIEKAAKRAARRAAKLLKQI